jgi:hypothetical protein
MAGLRLRKWALTPGPKNLVSSQSVDLERLKIRDFPGHEVLLSKPDVNQVHDLSTWGQGLSAAGILLLRSEVCNLASIASFAAGPASNICLNESPEFGSSII